MQSKSCTQVKDNRSDSDNSNYVLSSAAWFATSPADQTNANSTVIIASSSISGYQPTAKKARISEPVNWKPSRKIISIDRESDIPTEPTSWLASLCTSSNTSCYSRSENPEEDLTADQRQQALSTGYITNLSVTSSVRRIAEVMEELTEASFVNSKTR